MTSQVLRNTLFEFQVLYTVSKFKDFLVDMRFKTLETELKRI